MTSKKSSSNNFAANRLKNYTYLFVINSLVYFFSIPFVLFMTIDRYINMNEQKWMHEEITRFFSNYMYDISFLHIIVATITALVLFNYLNSKKQINFYHSHPITRKSLFTTNAIIGVVVGLLPYAVMFFISLAYGVINYRENILLSTVLYNLIFNVSVYIFSFMVTSLAAQFSGTTLFTIYCTGFLHMALFAVPTLTCTVFDTFSETMGWNGDKLLNLSLPSYIIAHNNAGSYMPICILLGLSIIMIIGTIYLYNKRPSEKSENTSIYKIPAKVIKYITVYCASLVAALIFGDMGAYGFYLFGLIVFAVISSVAFDIFLNKSFRNSRKYLVPALITAALVFVISFGIENAASSFDRSVPDVSKINTIKMDFSTLDISDVEITDKENINNVINLLNIVTSNDNFRDKPHIKDRNYYDYNENDFRIKVQYNDDFYWRTYTILDSTLVIDELSKIYDNEEFKNNASMEYFKTIDYLNNENNIDDIVDFVIYERKENSGDENYFVRDYYNKSETEKFAKELFTALKNDFMSTSFTDIYNDSKNSSYPYRIEYGINQENETAVSYTSYDHQTIYNSYKNSVSLIDKFINEIDSQAS